jgi:hypothetical protein
MRTHAARAPTGRVCMHRFERDRGAIACGGDGRIRKYRASHAWREGGAGAKPPLRATAVEFAMEPGAAMHRIDRGLAEAVEAALFHDLVYVRPNFRSAGRDLHAVAMAVLVVGPPIA